MVTEQKANEIWDAYQKIYDLSVSERNETLYQIVEVLNRELEKIKGMVE